MESKTIFAVILIGLVVFGVALTIETTGALSTEYKNNFETTRYTENKEIQNDCNLEPQIEVCDLPF